MYHVSKFLVANRPFIPPPPLVSQNRRRPASPKDMGWEEDDHSVLGCEARWSMSDHTPVIPIWGNQSPSRKSIVVYDRMIGGNCMIVSNCNVTSNV